MAAWTDYKEQARERGSLAFEVFVAISSPRKTPEEMAAVRPDHLAYVQSLESSGSLMFAGPLSDESGENTAGIGMLIFRAASFEQARTLAANDPMHATGARTFVLRRWLINEGSLNISIGLSTGGIKL